MDTNALININGNGTPTLEIVVMMTVIMLLPSLVVVMTSFTRTIIILSFTRQALGIQQTPPNMVLVGIALFLTIFIMRPVVDDINKQAYEPYTEGRITQEQALERAQVPMKQFMLRQTEVSSVNLFMELADIEEPENMEELPLSVVVPSFMTSELKRGFMAGFLIFIPFLLIDIIVASVLMSMGMIMLPPATIALPFKLLLFVTVNGWELLFQAIVNGFNF
ncbi:MAG: flagellar type III secretion system pore protein FliP [Firmicutes bacterium]|jgi:flagellar biosynthetic protein FliP|nr:flagellar type III secretion system pore protein FliP [Bacillota bacterium]NBI63810.1 flagellar biosynthetic protein FliP [Clostridiales bacterium]